MTEPVTVLDPTAEATPDQRSLNPRPVGLEGLTVGLLDINKPRGNVFLDRLEEISASRHQDHLGIWAVFSLGQKIRRDKGRISVGVCDNQNLRRSCG